MNKYGSVVISLILCRFLNRPRQFARLQGDSILWHEVVSTIPIFCHGPFTSRRNWTRSWEPVRHGSVADRWGSKERTKSA